MSLKSRLIKMNSCFFSFPQSKALRSQFENVGISNYSTASMREADRVLKEHGLRLVSNQVKYSLLNRKIEYNGIVDIANELGIAMIAYSPLEQGILSGKFHRNEGLVKAIKGPRKWSPGFRASGLKKSLPLIEALEEIAMKYNASTTQVALNWMIHSKGETVLRSLEQRR